MKGIILAGGSGTRLYPITKIISKHILPIYDKPMIYYPLSVLMMAGITEVLIISTPRDIVFYKELLLDGDKLGIKISYAIQDEPKGIAEAFIIGEEFIGSNSVTLILGDNIFIGNTLQKKLEDIVIAKQGATVLAYKVQDPCAFGVVEFDSNNSVISIEEKPKYPKSNYIVPGLYIYDNKVIEIAKKVIPSKRGELEITSINNEYLKEGKLYVQVLENENFWLDTGTCKCILKASVFVEKLQKESGRYVGCIEEIAYRKGYIAKENLLELANTIPNKEYREYLIECSKEA